MRLLFFILSFVSISVVYSQFTIIPTYSESDRFEVQMVNGVVFILGNDGYFAKLNETYDEIIPLVSPGMAGFTRDNLNVLNQDTIYVSCHKDFPHHGYVMESTDGGESWSNILDTTDILFTDLLMFDSNHGVVITTFYRSLLTVNNGEDWTEGYHGLIGSSASYKLNDSTGMIGISDDFNITTDKGESWEVSGFIHSTPQAFYSKHKDSIYAVTYGGDGVFFAYIHNFGEEAWIERSIPDFEPRGVNVKNTDEVFVLGMRPSKGTGHILKTADLGLSWSYYDTEIESALDDIVFINDSTAIIGGDNGTLLKWNSSSHFEMLGNIENEKEELELIQVYPNPTNDAQLINIELNEPLDGVLYLMDINGKLMEIVNQGHFNEGTNSFDLSFSKYPDGIYYYVIIFNDGRSFYRKSIKL